jgi:hypothetical protein
MFYCSFQNIRIYVIDFSICFIDFFTDAQIGDKSESCGQLLPVPGLQEVSERMCMRQSDQFAMKTDTCQPDIHWKTTKSFAGKLMYTSLFHYFTIAECPKFVTCECFHLYVFPLC